MRTETASSLRQRMIEDMNARKLGSHTQRSHILSCKRFAAFLKRSPDTVTLEDIRLFQLHLSEAGVSICNRNRIMTGLRFLFPVTLRRLDLTAEIYHIREPQKIARAYMLDHLPEDAQARHSWQKAAELLLAAADGLDDVGAATGQVELAIFLQAKFGAAKD